MDINETIKYEGVFAVEDARIELEFLASVINRLSNDAKTPEIKQRLIAAEQTVLNIVENNFEDDGEIANALSQLIDE